MSRTRYAKREESDPAFHHEFVTEIYRQVSRNFANTLKGAIGKSGLTQKEFVKIVGASKSALPDWLKGNLPGNARTFVKIAQVCGYTLDDIIYLPGVDFQNFSIRPHGQGIGVFRDGNLISIHPVWQLALSEVEELVWTNRPTELNYEI